MGKKKFRTEKEMFPLIKSYLEGDKSRINFCNENDIKLHVFNYWLGRYRQDNAKMPIDKGVNFAKIVVEPKKIAQEITIQCSNGIIIKIPM